MRNVRPIVIILALLAQGCCSIPGIWKSVELRLDGSYEYRPNEELLVVSVSNRDSRDILFQVVDVNSGACPVLVLYADSGDTMPRVWSAGGRTPLMASSLWVLVGARRPPPPSSVRNYSEHQFKLSLCREIGSKIRRIDVSLWCVPISGLAGVESIDQLEKHFRYVTVSLRPVR